MNAKDQFLVSRYLTLIVAEIPSDELIIKLEDFVHGIRNTRVNGPEHAVHSS